MKKAEFEALDVGETVWLNSGSMGWTVEAVRAKHVIVSWFSANKVLQARAMPFECLSLKPTEWAHARLFKHYDVQIGRLPPTESV